MSTATLYPSQAGSHICTVLEFFLYLQPFQEGKYQLTEERHHQDGEAGHGFWETSPGNQ